MKTIDPTEISARAFYKYMTASVAPRPIAFVSTIDDGGRANLSPFSFFNMMGIDPPIIAFAPNRRSADGSQKHTAINARQVPEVVVNMVTAEMVQQISLASAEFARGVNEFAKAGFTELPSRVVAPPRVLESPVQLECKVLEIIEKGSMELILAEVVLAHFSEDLLDDAGQIDQKKTSWVARLGGDWFAHTDHLFEVPRPQMGIGVDALPESIRNSKILTGNDLGRLGSVLLRPDPEKVIAYGQKAEIRQKIQEATLGCLYVPDVLHAYAHQLLEVGKTEEAWLVLLQ